jgi:hypothetical protein
LRRHLLLLDFMLSAALNHSRWLPDAERARHLTQRAHELWFS